MALCGRVSAYFEFHAPPLCKCQACIGIIEFSPLEKTANCKPSRHHLGLIRQMSILMLQEENGHGKNPVVLTPIEQQEEVSHHQNDLQEDVAIPWRPYAGILAKPALMIDPLC